MRARYSDLVWDLKHVMTGQKPSHEYAAIAIDSYLEATDKKFYTMEVNGIQWLGRALDLSRSIKDSECNKRVVDFMFEFYDHVAQPQFLGTWLFLFDNLYGFKDVSAEQESRVIAYLEKMLAIVSDAKVTEEGVHPVLDPWAAEAAAQRLAQHFRRKNDKPNVERVISAYGKAFEHVARNANPMMAAAWLQPVIERYEQEGLKHEAERLHVVVGEKSKNIASDLKTLSVQIDVKPEDVEKLRELLLGSGDLHTSLYQVAHYFIPRVDAGRKLLEKLRTDAPFLSLIPIKIIGSDGSPVANIGSLDEDMEGRLHQQLGQIIGFYQPFLEDILFKLKERYHPTVDDVLGFLSESPLFADIKQELLKEGLSAHARGDFVKSIHILVPQVELIMRTFLGRLGAPTRKTVRNHPGITDAKNMNDVLADARMRDSLTENLWRYLAVVYIDRRGLNLRNNLAHGLLPCEGFNKHIANRVFHTLLSLSLMRAPKEERKGE